MRARTSTTLPTYGTRSDCPSAGVARASATAASVEPSTTASGDVMPR